jgi:hypothetical protein
VLSRCGEGPADAGKRDAAAPVSAPGSHGRKARPSRSVGERTGAEAGPENGAEDGGGRGGSGSSCAGDAPASLGVAPIATRMPAARTSRGTAHRMSRG